jgi:hypothetical protein
MTTPATATHVPAHVSAHVSATTPYAWPWDGQLEPLRTALVLVYPAFGLTVDDTEEGARLRAIAGVLAVSGGTVIQVMTVPPPGADGEAAATPPLGREAGPVLRARGVDGFYESGLETCLREAALDQLLLVGAGLETCVHSTMRSANDRGLECLLVLDACVPYDHTLVVSSRSQVEMSGGIFGAVGSTAAVLDAYASFVPERLNS